MVEFCLVRYRSDFLETFRLEDLKELLEEATLEGIRIKAADLIREMEEAEEPKAGFCFAFAMELAMFRPQFRIVYTECCMYLYIIAVYWIDTYRALQIIYSYSIPQFMVEWHGINKHYNSTVDELTFADVVSTCVMSFWDAENRGSCNWKIWSQGFILPSRPQKLQQIVGPNFPSFNFVCIFFVVAVWCTLPGFKYVISEGGVESIGKQTIQLFHTHAPDCAGTSLRISLGNMEQLGLSCNIQTWWGAISCVRHVVFPLKVLILDQAPRTKLYLNARAFPSVQRSGVQRLRSVAILAGSGGQQSH